MKKYILFALTTVLALILISSVCMADSSSIVYHTGMKPTEQRPRVFFNSSDIPGILENAQKEPNKSQWERFLSFAGEEMPGELKNGFVFTAQAASYIESKAFYYAIYGDENTGRAAIDELKEVLEGNSGVEYDYNSAGEAIYLTGVVYDWCYPLLTAEDKAYFQNQVINLASHTAPSWPPTHGSAVMSHSAEGNLMRDLLCAAIAMYEDNDEIYQNVMGRFFSEYVDARKFMYEGGYFFPGLHYLSYRYQWEIISTKLIDAAYGIKSVYGEKQKDIIYSALYSRRPDGSFLKSGDNAFNNHYFGSRSHINLRALLYTASYFDDPYINGEAQKLAGIYNFNQTNVNQTVTPVEFLIMSDPDVDTKSVSELPLTRFFGSPYGAMIARTGWDEGVGSGAVVAEMKVVENQFNEHQHLDAGAFQIYYKGGLANDTGYYQAAYYSSDGRDTLNDGNTIYAGAHDNNYQSRTIAHNSMLVYDPAEVFLSKQGTATSYIIENDGGQERKSKSSAPKNITSYNQSPAAWRSGRVMGAEFGASSTNPDWSYLKGDISYAYSDKVSGYERSFMFLNLKDTPVPAAIMVFDRVESSDPSFKKTWLLHTKNTPVINGNRIVAEVTDNGYNGKLTLDALLPKADNLSINVTEGGEGDAWVNGTNYYASVLPNRINEGGGSRVEISPKAKQNEDFFLNVIQVGDADSDATLDVSPIQSDTHVGAVIANRTVLFGKEKERISDDISFTFASDEECIITVADCVAGTWNIYDEYGLYDIAAVNESGGILSFEAPGGSYTLTYEGSGDYSVTNVGFDPRGNHVDYISSRTYDGSTSANVQSAHFTESIVSGVHMKAPEDLVYKLTPVASTAGNFIHNGNRASSAYGYIKASAIESEFMLTDSSAQIALAVCAYSEGTSGAIDKENWLYNLISVSEKGFYVNNSNAVGGVYLFDTSVIPAMGKQKIADSVSLDSWHKIRVVFSASGRYMKFYFDDNPCVSVPLSEGCVLLGGLKIFTLTGRSTAVSGVYPPIYTDNISCTTAYALSENTYFEGIENDSFEPMYSMSDIFTYYISGGRCTITGIKGGNNTADMTDITVPADIGGYSVCGISEGAFKSCTALDKLIILTELEAAGDFLPDADNIDVYCSRATRSILEKSCTDGANYFTGVYVDGTKIYSLCDSLRVYAASYSGNKILALEIYDVKKFGSCMASQPGRTYYLWSEGIIPVQKPITFN